MPEAEDGAFHSRAFREFASDLPRGRPVNPEHAKEFFTEKRVFSERD
jgi:hypothetical protein